MALADPAGRTAARSGGAWVGTATLRRVGGKLGALALTLFLGERVTGVAPSIAFLYYPWAATIGAR